MYFKNYHKEELDKLLSSYIEGGGWYEVRQKHELDQQDYAVNWNETSQIADTKYIVYGAGLGVNKCFVHVELCETADYTKFKLSYEKYVKLWR